MNYNNIEHLTKADETGISCIRHSFLNKNIHWHSYYEIEFVIKGKGTHIINGTSYAFKAGDVFLLRPSEFHEFALEEEGTTFLIEIPPILFPTNVLDFIIHINQNLIIHLEEPEFNILKTLFILIESHCQKDGLLNAAIIQSLLSSLILLFVDYINVNPINQIEKCDKILRKIIIYIHQHFYENITLESISSMFYINKEYLSSVFKYEIGMGLTAYIRKLRLSHAAKLAVTTNLKSIEISESCGFNSVQTFLRNFKLEYGVSPLEMRENSKNSAK